MPSINLNGELFHYASVGEGLPFVFQHGMGADVTQPLSSGGTLAGWRMIAMDCRGHGQTEASLDPERISFARFAEDLAVLLDSLNIECVVVGGISMGAGVALAFALANPDRVNGLILFAPHGSIVPFRPIFAGFPSRRACSKSIPPTRPLSRCKQSPAFSELAAESKPAADSLLGQFRRPHARERAVILARMPASAPVTSLTHCRQLQIPILVVVNARDPVHPDILGEQLAAAIPGAALSRITSKAESETLHQADLARTLHDFLEPIRRQFSPRTLDSSARSSIHTQRGESSRC